LHPVHTTFYIRLYFFMLKGSVQPKRERHECGTQRNRDRRPGTIACSGCWVMGNNKVKDCSVLYLGRLEQPREDYCTGTTSL
jgi:hypothetical protein